MRQTKLSKLADIPTTEKTVRMKTIQSSFIIKLNLVPKLFNYYYETY